MPTIQVESQLLLLINRSLPKDIQGRYQDLLAKRRQATLTPEEHGDLLRLTDQVEQLQAERLEGLAELARLRRTTLPALMASLGLRAPAHE